MTICMAFVNDYGSRLIARDPAELAHAREFGGWVLTV